MNVNPYNTTDYEIFLPLAGQKNKPNSNPIKPNLRKAKMNVTLLATKDYRKKDDFAVRKNKPNLVRRRRIPKMNANLYFIEDYENISCWRLKKTNPIKACPERSRMGQFQTSDICLLFSVFCFLSSVIRPQSSVLRPLFPDAAQIIEFSPEK